MIMELVKKIERWWRWEAKYYPSNIKMGIRNIFVWWKIIWKDRQWDDSFFLDLLEFKFKRMIQYWEREDIVRHVNMEYDVWLMKICVKLIHIVRDEEYSMKAYDELEERWGEMKMRFEPWTGPDHDGIKREGLSELFLDRPKILTDEDQRLYDIDYKKTMDVAYAKEAKAKKLLFNIMERRIKYWWT